MPPPKKKHPSSLCLSGTFLKWADDRLCTAQQETSSSPSRRKVSSVATIQTRHRSLGALQHSAWLRHSLRNNARNDLWRNAAHAIQQYEKSRMNDAPSASSSGETNDASRSASSSADERTTIPVNNHVVDRGQGFLDDLINQTEMMIFCEIAILCYMDCSLFQLIIRLIPQSILANFPKPGMLPLALSKDRHFLISIIWTNFLCLALHILCEPPAGSELSRGYIHGGLIIDFLGEPAPVPKVKMVMVDLCIFGLQLLLLAADVQRKNPMSRRLGARDVDPQTSRQDVDAEEQGVRRSQEDQRNSISSSNEEDRLEAQGDAATGIDETYSGQTVILSASFKQIVVCAWRK